MSSPSPLGSFSGCTAIKVGTPKPRLYSSRTSVPGDFMKNIDADVIGNYYGEGKDNHVDNKELIEINEAIRFHPIEIIGYDLRESMTAMTKIV